MISQITEFGRADKGEVSRIKKHDRPLAFQVIVGDGDKLAIMISGGVKRLDGGVDQRHGENSFEVNEVRWTNNKCKLLIILFDSFYQLNSQFRLRFDCP